MSQFHLPTKPLSKIDAINRRAAATGSIGYAQQCADADYNGHYLNVWFNDYRGYYICEYFWGGRVVIARGIDAADVLRAAVAEFARQGRGASLNVTLRDCDDGVAADFNLISGAEPQGERAWWWNELSGAFSYERHGLAPAVGFLANSDTLAEYGARCKAFFAERRASRQPA